MLPRKIMNKEFNIKNTAKSSRLTDISDNLVATRLYY